MTNKTNLIKSQEAIHFYFSLSNDQFGDPLWLLSF